MTVEQLEVLETLEDSIVDYKRELVAAKNLADENHNGSGSKYYLGQLTAIDWVLSTLRSHKP